MYLQVLHGVFQGLDGVSRVSSLDGAGVADTHLVIQAVVPGEAQEVTTQIRSSKPDYWLGGEAGMFL